LHLHGAEKPLPAGWAKNFNMAMDAQPTLQSAPNSAIPSFLTQYYDPKLIDVLFAPMKAAQVAGERQLGDWTTQTATFELIEMTGAVTSYGDYNNSGQAKINFNFPQRQAYYYQTMTRWGELELERAGLAKIDYANRLNMSSVYILNKFQNQTYLFGVSGLQAYGMTNDPSLTAPISPATKAAGGTGWPKGTGLEVYADIQSLYAQAQTQLNGNIDLESDMTLIMPPTSQTYLTNTTQFNVNVMDLLEKNFPNMKIETIPEYATASGNLMQLVVNQIDGQKTWECAFNEKLRSHPVIIEESAFKQKKSQGTYGTVIYRPIAIAQMLGI